MCLSQPSMPTPAEPAKPQEAKAPDTPKMMADSRTARKNVGAMGGGTLLTGNGGAATAATAGALGKTSLLGQ